jgi:hypothetical protein
MLQTDILRIACVAGLLWPTSIDLLAQRAGSSSYVPLPAPALIIGRDGDPDYEFVNIAAVHRLPTGHIAVADRRSRAVQVYDPMGQLVRKLGREGEGPGEFRRLYDLFVAGDTLIVFDSSLLRLTRYLATGTLVGTQPVRTAAGDERVYVAGRLPSGRWLVVTPNSPSWTRGPGIYRDTLRVGTVAPSSGGPVRWIGNFPGATFFAYMPGQDKTRWAVGWAFFAPNHVVATRGDTIVVGDTGTPELKYFLADGRQVRRLTVPLDAPPDLTQHRNGARDEELAQAGANRAYVQAMYDAPRPAPRYRDFVVASDGSLWIRLFEEAPDSPVRYLVLSAAGAVRARVSLPPRSTVLTVQSPWVLYVLRDANDVERVAVVRWELH